MTTTTGPASYPQTYAVHEIFPTIQGEGVHSGVPAAFVRLMGCGVGCPFCDTKMTWVADPENQLEQLPHGPRGTEETFSRLTAEQIVDRVEATGLRHMVLTGGEPAEQNLRALSLAARGAGIYLQIETSGTADLGNATFDWVTVSPKVGMPGGKSIVAATVKRANEIKWVVGKAADIDRLIMFIEQYSLKDTPICLQPLSQSRKATDLCVAACQQHGWRLSVQIHKVIGVA